ncbi:MAG: hypothetical protein HC908_18260 [Calothrix sp. SM1_7_51]|nr:hypothetical protein [Calothrix sp. SM1_7_51]
MFNKGNLTLLFIVLLIFVGFGDSFLPAPLSTASFTTRTTINNFAIGMFPGWRPKVNPEQRTKDAIEQTEGKAK